jgi:hypothetical protein
MVPNKRKKEKRSMPDTVFVIAKDEEDARRTLHMAPHYCWPTRDEAEAVIEKQEEIYRKDLHVFEVENK